MSTRPQHATRMAAGAKVMAEVPFDSEGQYANLILNWRLDPQGFLDSTQRKMKLFPVEWNPGQAAPDPVLDDGVLAIGYVALDGGERPEVIFLTKTGVFRYAPWNRQTAVAGMRGLEEVLEYRYDGESNAAVSVTPQGKIHYPPQLRALGNRLYFTFCDGGGAWVWDGDRLRRFGYPDKPGPIDAQGPSTDRLDADFPNDGGFSMPGRIGTTDPAFTRLVEKTFGSNNYAHAEPVGGIHNGRWKYGVVWENVDGAYSATSPAGPICTIRRQVAEPGNGLPMEILKRRFWLRNLPEGPPGTVAKILVRTANLEFLPTGNTGGYHFLHRVPNNVAREWIDDIPDGELGAPWQEREATPHGFFFLEFFGGSAWLMRTPGNPSRVWWSEQGPFGTVAESILLGHWRELFPETGAITGSITTRPAVGDGSTMMLVFKEEATHYIAGTFPDWGFGTLHRKAGLAGPELVQNCPDGSVIWYGAGTFWRFDPTDGSVIDVGAPIRKRLKRVNKTGARFGRSWIDRVQGEVRFALPTDDSETNDMHFVWDYLSLGWRLGDDLAVGAALSVPGSDIVLLAGSVVAAPGSILPLFPNPAVWIYGRGYPGEVWPPREAVYRTGWSSLDGQVHQAYWNGNHFLLMQEERGFGLFTTRSFVDWNLDAPQTEETTGTRAHPENDDIAYYSGGSAGSPARYGESVYRSVRIFSQQIPLGAEGFQVLMVEVSTFGAMAFFAGTVHGPAIATIAGRTPSAA